MIERIKSTVGDYESYDSMDGQSDGKSDKNSLMDDSESSFSSADNEELSPMAWSTVIPNAGKTTNESQSTSDIASSTTQNSCEPKSRKTHPLSNNDSKNMFQKQDKIHDEKDVINIYLESSDDEADFVLQQFASKEQTISGSDCEQKSDTETLDNSRSSNEDSEESKKRKGNHLSDMNITFKKVKRKDLVSLSVMDRNGISPCNKNVIISKNSEISPEMAENTSSPKREHSSSCTMTIESKLQKSSQPKVGQFDKSSIARSLVVTTPIHQIRGNIPHQRFISIFKMMTRVFNEVVKPLLCNHGWKFNSKPPISDEINTRRTLYVPPGIFPGPPFLCRVDYFDTKKQFISNLQERRQRGEWIPSYALKLIANIEKIAKEDAKAFKDASTIQKRLGMFLENGTFVINDDEWLISLKGRSEEAILLDSIHDSFDEEASKIEKLKPPASLSKEKRNEEDEDENVSGTEEDTDNEDFRDATGTKRVPKFVGNTGKHLFPSSAVKKIRDDLVEKWKNEESSDKKHISQISELNALLNLSIVDPPHDDGDKHSLIMQASGVKVLVDRVGSFVERHVRKEVTKYNTKYLLSDPECTVMHIKFSTCSSIGAAVSSCDWDGDELIERALCACWILRTPEGKEMAKIVGHKAVSLGACIIEVGGKKVSKASDVKKAWAEVQSDPTIGTGVLTICFSRNSDLSGIDPRNVVKSAKGREYFNTLQNFSTKSKSIDSKDGKVMKAASQLVAKSAKDQNMKSRDIQSSNTGTRHNGLASMLLNKSLIGNARFKSCENRSSSVISNRNVRADTKKDKGTSNLSTSLTCMLKGSNNATEYSLTFDASSPIGFYCETDKTGNGNSVCKVMSVSPEGLKKDSRLQSGTIVSATALLIGSVVVEKRKSVFTHSELKRRYEASRIKKSKLRIFFIKMEKDTKDLRKGNWTSSGSWKGKNSSKGWAGGAGVLGAGTIMFMPTKNSQFAIGKTIERSTSNGSKRKVSQGEGSRIVAKVESLKKGSVVVKSILRMGRKDDEKSSGSCVIFSENLCKTKLFVPDKIDDIEDSSLETNLDGSIKCRPLTKSGNDALSYAVKYQSLKDVMQQLEAGAHPQQRDSQNKRPLDYANEAVENIHRELSSANVSNNVVLSIKERQEKNSLVNKFNMKKKAIKIFIEAETVIEMSKQFKKWTITEFFVDAAECLQLSDMGISHPCPKLLFYAVTIDGVPIPRATDPVPFDSSISWEGNSSKKFLCQYNIDVEETYKDKVIVIDFYKGSDRGDNIKLGHAAFSIDAVKNTSSKAVALPTFGELHSSITGSDFLLVGGQASLKVQMKPRDIASEEKRRLDLCKRLSTLVDWIDAFHKEIKGQNISFNSNIAISILGNVSLLHAAVLLEDKKILQRLILLGGNPRFKSEIGNPLELALEQGCGSQRSTDLCAVLLEKITGTPYKRRIDDVEPVPEPQKDNQLVEKKTVTARKNSYEKPGDANHAHMTNFTTNVECCDQDEFRDSSFERFKKTNESKTKADTFKSAKNAFRQEHKGDPRLISQNHRISQEYSQSQSMHKALPAALSRSALYEDRKIVLGANIEKKFPHYSVNGMLQLSSISLPELLKPDWMATKTTRCAHFDSPGNFCPLGTDCHKAHIHPLNVSWKEQIDPDDFIRFYSKAFGLKPIKNRDFYQKQCLNSAGERWFTSAFKCPNDNTIYYAEKGYKSHRSPQGIYWYPEQKIADSATRSVVVAALRSKEGSFDRRKRKDLDCDVPDASREKRKKTDNKDLLVALKKANFQNAYVKIFPEQQILRKSAWKFQTIDIDGTKIHNATFMSPAEKNIIYHPEGHGGILSDGKYWYEDERTAKSVAFFIFLSKMAKMGKIADLHYSLDGRPLLS